MSCLIVGVQPNIAIGCKLRIGTLSATLAASTQGGTSDNWAASPLTNFRAHIAWRAQTC